MERYEREVVDLLRQIAADVRWLRQRTEIRDREGEEAAAEVDRMRKEDLREGPPNFGERLRKHVQPRLSSSSGEDT